jgi:hypothetical protein
MRQKPLKLEEREWTPDMGPEIRGAQKKLRAAIASGQVRAWGRKQPHALLELIPSDPFRIPGLIVIVGEHGDMRPLLPHKQCFGPRWDSIEFEADEIKHAFPQAESAAGGASEGQGSTPSKPSRPKSARSKPALERARGAITELYPDGVPGQAAEPNVILCRRVGEKLKQAGLPDVSNDTILRAAGRRK